MWSKEDIALYQQRTEEEKEDTKELETSSEGKWQGLKRQVHSAMVKKQLKKKNGSWGKRYSGINIARRKKGW